MFDLSSTFGALARGLLLTSAAMVWILILVRLVGLRSFSKMTAFDFVTTIAVGSLLATIGTTSEWTAFTQGLVALAALFLVQSLLARGRRHSESFARLIGNDPILLMENGEFIQAALEQSRVTRTDVYAKLRKANAVNMTCVRAVVLETTGDISVLHGPHVDDEILTGVHRVSSDDSA